MKFVTCTILFSCLLTFSVLGQMFTSSNLPILIIDTDSGLVNDEPKSPGSMKIVYNEDGTRNEVDANEFHYDGFIGIELRGQSSLALFPKKGYGLETRDADGENNNVSLFGWPEENDWVIHSPYSDKSLMRNAITYDIASELMAYAPRTQFCELVLNGEYLGVVLFTEKIKRDKGRVDVSKLRPEDIEGDQLTGGYLFKFDKGQSFEIVYTSDYRPEGNLPQATNFYYVYPKYDQIQAEQKNYIRSFISDMEDALSGSNFRDSLDGYHKYIDPKTFIDFMIVNELTRNVDGYRISTFMYKDRDSIDARLKMGPVWDFNLGYGNANYCDGGLMTGWAYNFNDICPNDGWVNHFWWKKLLSDSAFSDAFRERWKELREGILSDANVLQRISDYQNLLSESAPRNFARWPILNQEIWPNTNVSGSYSGEVNFLKNWLLGRMEWIDQNTLTEIGPPLVDGESVKLYPNPTTGILFLSKPICSRCEILVFDMLGRDVTGSATIYEDRLELSQSNGIYTIFIEDDLGNVNNYSKIIVQIKQ